MEKKQMTARELLEALKAIRRRPISKKDIEEHNKIIEKDDEIEREQKERERKIARNKEVAL